MTKEISVFVDESGSFSPAGSDLHSPYYLLCMVFHDQSDDISKEIEQLNAAFVQTGLDADHTVHAGPMIRREDEYRSMPRELRIRIFRRMMVSFRKPDSGIGALSCLNLTILEAKPYTTPFFKRL